MPHNARPNALCWCSKMRRKYAQKRRPQRGALGPDGQVGAPGFEPGTSCSQSRRDTGLRYAPKVRASYYTRPSARNALRSARNARALWLNAAVFSIDDSANVPPSSRASKYGS